MLLAGDLTEEKHCRQVVERTVDELGGLHVLVNNVAYQQPQDSLTAITTAQWERTLRTTITSYFFRTRSALQHLGRGDAIIDTSSITGLRGNRRGACSGRRRDPPRVR